MPSKENTIRKHLETLLDELAARQPIKQAIIALETGDQSFRWSAGLAEKDGGGSTSRGDAPFFIASIDKLYNATIVMMLSESGLVRLNDPITEYLPRSVTRGLHRMGAIDFSQKITVRHLLSHTSGLADWLEDIPEGGTSLVDRIFKEGDRALSIEEISGYVRDHLTPHFPPQELTEARPKARYSDTNFMLIIALIETVTGQSLHQVHEQMLYKPLGLRQTYFPGLSEPLEATPDPVVLHAEGRPLRIPLLMRSIRGIYSTASDTLSFLRMLMQNEVFQNPASLSFMQSTWNRFGFPTDRAALRLPQWPLEYALGIMRFRIPRLLTPFHAIPEVVGHTGSTGCWLFWCPEWDVYLTGSVDEATSGAVPYRIVPRILKALGPLLKHREHNGSNS